MLARAVMEMVDVAHRRISRAVDLTRLRVLGLLAHEGPMRPSAVATALGLTPSATSRHLAALRRDGLLTETADLTDDRTFLAGIADSGRTEIDTVMSAGAARFVQAIESWSDAEVDEALRVIDRLMSSFAAPAPSQPSRPRPTSRTIGKRP